MPYDPDHDPDPFRDPLGYDDAPTQYIHRISKLFSNTNGTSRGQTAGRRPEELSESDDHDAEFYEDARSELGDEPEEMHLDIPEKSELRESIESHGLRAGYEPRPYNSFTPITRIPTAVKAPQVAVVLNSAPRKEAYTVISNDELEYEEEEGAEDSFVVTSDLLPGSKRKRLDGTSIRPPSVHSPSQLKRPLLPLDSVTSLSPPKKRGRPVGWRPGSGPYSTSRPGEKPKKKPPGEAKRRGRPPRNPSPTPREIYLGSNPKFISFFCEWEKCPAELHNLETLRKHLLIVHGRPTPAACKWNRCAHQQPQHHFSTQDDFVSHIDKCHLASFAKLVGDGPCNNSGILSAAEIAAMRGDADPLPSYLFGGQDGKEQVTPSIRDQELENDEDRKKRRIRLERVIAKRDRNAPEEPQYTPEQMRDIQKTLAAKKAKQKRLREYYERLGGDLRSVQGQGQGQNGDGKSSTTAAIYGPEWRGV